MAGDKSVTWSQYVLWMCWQTGSLCCTKGTFLQFPPIWNMQAMIFTCCLYVPATLGTRQQSTENAFLLFPLVVLHTLELHCSQPNAKETSLSSSTTALYPTGKHIKAVSPTQTSPFTEKLPCPLTHPPLNRWATSPHACQPSVWNGKARSQSSSCDSWFSHW